MNSTWIIVIFLTLQTIVAYIFGTQLQSTSPDGIWVYMSAADGSDKPSNAFYVGVSMGLFLMSLAYLTLSAAMYIWSGLKPANFSRFLYPVFISSIIGIVVMVVLAVFTW